MKTIRKLNIKDWSGYFFSEMVNILDIEPEHLLVNDFKSCNDDSTIFNLCYCEEGSVPHVVFSNVECIFRKRGVFSYLVFCENGKNKNMINNYVKVIDQLEKEILSWVDELEEDEIFTLRSDFTRFKFRTDDDLVYNKKINIPVCVISLSCVVKKGNIYYSQFKLQKCFCDCYPSQLNSLR